MNLNFTYLSYKNHMDGRSLKFIVRALENQCWLNIEAMVIELS